MGKEKFDAEYEAFVESISVSLFIIRTHPKRMGFV
jgi:hypothetical protein